MKIRNIIYLVIAAVISIAVSGCEKNVEQTEINSTISFSVRVSEVSYNYARINVMHNGPEDVTWYGFLTDDIKNNEGSIFYEKYIEIIESGDFSELRRENERSILVENLEEEKTYRYIVFGLKENGELYNNADLGSIEFKTSKNIYLLTQTEDWELKRLGRNEEGTKELIEVKAKKGGRFGWNFISKESLDYWAEEHPNGYELWVDDVYMTTVNGMQMYALEQISTIQYYVSNGYNLSDLTYVYEENAPFEIDRLASGTYYFFAYGFKGDGQHTQTFSVQEITIEEEKAKPEYEKWLGNYTFTGEVDVTLDNGEEVREERTYNIKIDHYDNNFMYKIHGWECGDDVKYDWEEDIMQLDKDKGEYLSFPAYYADGKLEIKENPMTYITFDGAQILLLGIYGYAFQNEANAEIPVIFDETTMALAEPIKDGETSTELIGQKAEYKHNNTTTKWEYCKMGYLAWDEQTGAYQTVNPPMRFPITITKVEGGAIDSLPENTAQSSKTLFNTKKISTDFLNNDFSRLEKLNPEIYQRAY